MSQRDECGTAAALDQLEPAVRCPCVQPALRPPSRGDADGTRPVLTLLTDSSPLRLRTRLGTRAVRGQVLGLGLAVAFACSWRAVLAVEMCKARRLWPGRGYRRDVLVRYRRTRFGLSSAAACAALLAVYALVRYPANVSLTTAGVEFGTLLVVALGLAVFAAVRGTRPGTASDAIALHQGTRWGLIAGGLWVVEIALGDFAYSLGSWTVGPYLASTAAAFAVPGVAGLCAAVDSGRVTTGGRAGLWCGIVSGLVGFLTLITVSLTSLPVLRADPQNLREYAHSGAADLDTFIVGDFLAAAATHLTIVGPLAGTLVGLLGGLIGVAHPTPPRAAVGSGNRLAPPRCVGPKRVERAIVEPGAVTQTERHASTGTRPSSITRDKQAETVLPPSPLWNQGRGFSRFWGFPFAAKRHGLTTRSRRPVAGAGRPVTGSSGSTKDQAFYVVRLERGGDARRAAPQSP